jgi:hypothetical protein
MKIKNYAVFSGAILAMLVLLSVAASATAIIPPSDGGIFIKYDKVAGIVPVSPVALVAGTDKLYSYDDGTVFTLQEAQTPDGLCIALIGADLGNKFVNENDLQKTRDAIREYGQTNGIKAKSYGSVTEKFRQRNSGIPSGKVGILYET